MKTFAEIAFTPAVQALQERHGSRAAYARLQKSRDPGEGLGPSEIAFLAEADSFYLATVGETGWPYIQHRGGPKGFLKPVGPARLAFADFRGNRQYVSAGNVAGNDRASIFVMNYAARARLKLLGRLRFEEAGSANAAILAGVIVPDFPASRTSSRSSMSRHSTGIAPAHHAAVHACRSRGAYPCSPRKDPGLERELAGLRSPIGMQAPAELPVS